VETLLAGDGMVTREQVESLAAKQGVVHARPSARQSSRTSIKSGVFPVEQLLVELDGQEVILDLKSRPSKTAGEVQLPDGMRRTVELARLRPIAWKEA
jgi:hypothetical protein